MATKYGTSYFPTRGNAIRYYRDYEGKDAATAVDRKLAAGEIHIGKPPLKPGDVLTIEDCRYHVTEGVMRPPFAVCQFHEDGTIFPVRMSIPSQTEAEQARTWMKVGAGQLEDWRVITMIELRDYLDAGKLDLKAFTPEAQAEKRAEILRHGGAK